MYLDAMEFLEEEHEGWVPFQALADLSDAALEQVVDGAHGWTGRDLMAHLAACQALSLDAARELAVGETSPTIARVDADWEARGGDVVNAEIQATWAAMPLDELRATFRSLPGELRGTLTVVPEARWVKHPTYMAWFDGETVDHYREHVADLRVILAAARE